MDGFFSVQVLLLLFFLRFEKKYMYTYIYSPENFSKQIETETSLIMCISKNNNK